MSIDDNAQARAPKQVTMTGMYRPQLVLYSAPTCVYCHRVRLVLAEKSVCARIINVDPDEPSDELAAINPEARVPTLLDRGLAVFGTRTLIDYLDERYPAPSLLPVAPVERARYRMLVDRIEARAYPLAEMLDSGENSSAHVKRELADWLALIVADLAAPARIDDSLSLIDCSLAPLLWRVGEFGLSLKFQNENNGFRDWRAYAQRLFGRTAFEASLSRQEARMAPALTC